MQRSLALLIIGLFFGVGAGFLLAAANGVTLDGHDHDHKVAETAMGDHAHKHDQALVIPEGENAPTIDVIMHKDAVAGWNLEIITTNFTFSPETVNQPNELGKGHAHVYANGEKLARIYAPWMHIGSLPAGETTVSASLNANDHSPISVGDKLLSAETVIQVE